MKTGIYKNLLVPLKIKLDVWRFWYNKKIWGFPNAVLLFKTLHKQSVIPILKSNGASIGENCDIETGITFHNCKSFENLIIGNNSHIGKNCFFDLREKIVIGNNVVISMNCTFLTHIDMNKSFLRNFYHAVADPLKINDDCYIGANSIILQGIELRKKSFVAAASLVTKNVEPFTMVGGVPAKFIKKLVRGNSNGK